MFTDSSVPKLLKEMENCEEYSFVRAIVVALKSLNCLHASEREEQNDDDDDEYGDDNDDNKSKLPDAIYSFTLIKPSLDKLHF